MQEIRDLSIEDLLTKLKEKKLYYGYGTLTICERRRKEYEKQLFLHVQDKKEPTLHKCLDNGSDYFLLDIDLPQTLYPGKSIRKRTMTRKPKKSVRFKQTEIFGNEPIYPYCVTKYNHNTRGQQLHAPECSKAVTETVEVLGQYRWMNRTSILYLLCSL